MASSLHSEKTTGAARAAAGTGTGTAAAAGGKTGKTEYWGLRNLAYRINKSRKGHYGLIDIDDEDFGVGISGCAAGATPLPTAAGEPPSARASALLHALSC